MSWNETSITDWLTRTRGVQPVTELPRQFTHAALPAEDAARLRESVPGVAELLDGPLSTIRLWRRRGAALQNKHRPLSRRDVIDVYETGGAVQVLDVERRFPLVGALCERLADELRAFQPQVVSQVILSSATAGAIPHFDPTHVLALQVHGTKTWQFPAVERRIPFLPSQGRQIDERPSLDELFRGDRERLDLTALDGTAVVEAGQCCFVPAGTPHATVRSADSYTVTLGIRPRSVRAEVSTLLAALHARCAPLDPCVPHTADAFERAALALLREAAMHLRASASPGAVGAAGRRSLASPPRLRTDEHGVRQVIESHFEGAREIRAARLADEIPGAPVLAASGRG